MFYRTCYVNIPKMEIKLLLWALINYGYRIEQFFFRNMWRNACSYVQWQRGVMFLFKFEEIKFLKCKKCSRASKVLKNVCRY